ncbi:10836_t:CDS:2, partial [Acaulospora morrowiae]
MSHQREKLEIIVHPPSPSLTSNTSESDPEISPSSPPNGDFFLRRHSERDVTVTTDNSTQTAQVKKKNDCCSRTCHKIKRVNEILTWVRLIVALTLYLLIAVDVIHIRKNKDKKFWVEVLTQLTNIEFTFLTLLMQPKRLINLPRAARIWWWNTKNTTFFNKVKFRRSAISQDIQVDLEGNNYSNYLQESKKPPDYIRELQRKVHESYNWYNYEDSLSEESEKMEQRKEIICSPSKLFFILILWNIGCLSQYGICVILWFLPQKQRPELPYIILSAITVFCEVITFIL